MGRSVTVQDVMTLVEELAPADLAEPWDNVGLQAGDPGRPVERVLVSLGVSAEVLDEAEAAGCGMVIAHHPLIFRPLAAVIVHRGVGSLVARALRAGIAVGAAHTNLDRAAPGVNDWLAEKLSLQSVRPLSEAAPGAGAEGPAAMGRIGRLSEPAELGAWAGDVAARLGVDALRYVGDTSRRVETVAVVGGSGSGAMGAAAAAGADALVTGDVKFHEALDALDLGIALVDPGHFASERFMREKLAKWIGEEARRRGWRLEAVPATREADPFRFYAAR